jgi:hypothetical protein
VGFGQETKRPRGQGLKGSIGKELNIHNVYYLYMYFEIIPNIKINKSKTNEKKTHNKIFFIIVYKLIQLNILLPEISIFS